MARIALIGSHHKDRNDIAKLSPSKNRRSGRVCYLPSVNQATGISDLLAYTKSVDIKKAVLSHRPRTAKKSDINFGSVSPVHFPAGSRRSAGRVPGSGLRDRARSLRRSNSSSSPAFRYCRICKAVNS